MQSSRRILHVIHEKNTQSLGKLLKDFAAALTTAGVESETLCVREENSSAPDAGAPDSAIMLTKKPGWDWTFAGKLRRLINHDKIDIVHTHDVYSLINVTASARFAGVKVIHTRHARLKDRISRLTGALNNHIVACAQDIKTDFLKNCAISESKISVIYDGISADSFSTGVLEERRQIRNRLGLREDSLVLVNGGRLIPDEDQASLLKAMRKMRQKKVNIELLLLGHGPSGKDLAALIEQYNLSDSVKILGSSPSTPQEAWQAADLAVLTFNREVYPVHILEAMARGKSVVATKIGSNAEIVTEGEDGFLVPCGFPERIESAVMRFAANRGLAAKMGDAARKRFLENFSMGKMVLGYKILYQKILGN